MTLENVIGQERAKQLLKLFQQTFDRKGKLPPIGIFGPSGLGKTHLVTEWAQELGAKLIYMNGTAIKDALAFRAYFKDADKDKDTHHIMFVDECHMLPRKVQENLLSVLEDPSILCTVAPREIGNVKCVDGTRWIDKGDVMREALPDNMSFIFATTDPAKMKDTILNRLRKIQLESYSVENKIEIAMRHLAQSGIVRSDLTIYEALAKRSRSLRHLKDDLCETFVDINNLYEPSEQLKVLDQILGIDADGAIDLDRDYLGYLAQHKIAGLDTLAGFLRISKDEIVTRLEPFMLERGWITITAKGRMLTEDGRRKVFGEELDPV